MLLFFDGEEAFVNWGPDDSIYGSRSLAAAWNSVKYPLHSSNTNHLDRIVSLTQQLNFHIVSQSSGSQLSVHYVSLYTLPF